jgi:RNA 3'-terminal phosphate cyclase (ATP)
VLQTVLPPLLTAAAESRVRISGGTHNKGAPPFDFLARAFLPQLARMGATVDLELASFGFYPRGGGEIRARITPAPGLRALALVSRGAPVRASAEAYIAGLPASIAERELSAIGKQLRWPREQLHLRALPADVGPGNAVTITLEHENVTEVFTGFGEQRVRAEQVALNAAREAQTWLTASAPVGEHLADQLLLPMALGDGGVFLATTATEHLRTNATIIERFTARRVKISPAAGAVEVTVTGT